MNMEKWSLLSRLQRAVRKVKVLLSLDIHRWRLASMMTGGFFSSSRRRFSFNDRPGLRACADDIESEVSSPSGSSRGLHRTISYPSEDDVDKRAEMFIQNFRRQLQIERQVSLELQYCRGNSFSSLASP